MDKEKELDEFEEFYNNQRQEEEWEALAIQDVWENEKGIEE